MEYNGKKKTPHNCKMRCTLDPNGGAPIEFKCVKSIRRIKTLKKNTKSKCKKAAMFHSEKLTESAKKKRPWRILPQQQRGQAASTAVVRSAARHGSGQPGRPQVRQPGAAHVQQLQHNAAARDVAVLREGGAGLTPGGSLAAGVCCLCRVPGGGSTSGLI